MVNSRAKGAIGENKVKEFLDSRTPYTFERTPGSGSGDIINMTNYLYHITSIDNKYIYIGVTNNLYRRKSAHFNNSHNDKLRALLSEKGISYFEFKVKEESEDRKYIESLEILQIKEYSSNNNYTILNKAPGGSGGNGSKGEDHFNSKLLQEDILDIRYRYAKGITKGRDLALEYGISYKTISKIARGDRWSHIGGPITTSTPREFKAATRRKLTDLEVIDLRETHFFVYTSMGKMPMIELEEIYNIARQNIRKILTGESYRHLPGPLMGVDYGCKF